MNPQNNDDVYMCTRCMYSGPSQFHTRHTWVVSTKRVVDVGTECDGTLILVPHLQLRED